MNNSIYNRLFNLLYYQPIFIYVLICAVGVVAWGKLGCRVNGRKWRCTNSIMFVGVVIVIVRQTLLFRKVSERVVEFTPFINIINSSAGEDVLRSMLMNVALFVPLGVLMPFMFRREWKRKRLMTIVLASVFSCLIEFLQCYFCIGRCEIDDVICNTVGAAIGTFSYQVFKKMKLGDK